MKDHANSNVLGKRLRIDKDREFREDDWDDEHANGTEKARVIKEEDEESQEEYYDSNRRQSTRSNAAGHGKPPPKSTSVSKNPILNANLHPQEKRKVESAKKVPTREPSNDL